MFCFQKTSTSFHFLPYYKRRIINSLGQSCTYNGNLKIVELLVSKGADIRAESVPGNVLDAAEAGGHQDIVNFLKPLM